MEENLRVYEARKLSGFTGTRQWHVLEDENARYPRKYKEF